MTMLVESIGYFILWSLVWTVVITLPPGTKEIQTSYRLNFLHGLISSIAAILALYDLIPESLASMTTISYFFVDFVNIMFNDFYFKVKSYQAPSARKIEYLHHILCFTVGVSCEFLHKKYCTFDRNPFIKLMFAELSTPFLIGWRVYPDKNYLFVLFALTFFGARIIYHGFVYVPECIQQCDKTIAYSFGVPYNLMNAFFMYMIVQRVFKQSMRGNGKKKDGVILSKKKD